MRHLKNKLAKARENALLHQRPEEEEDEVEETSEVSSDSKVTDSKLSEDSSPVTMPTRGSKTSKKEKSAAKGGKMERGATSAKNIVKNYGRALANFAASNLALPYLTKLIDKENIRVKDFRRFIASKKKRARCIAGLRQLLVVEREDSEHIAAFKRIFKEVSVIFIKYFSVNWIFSGKLCDKMTHLKYRFKILRRIRSPEHFTYLKGFS